MFNNSRLTQPNLSDILSVQITNDTIPGSLLFSGEPFSSRLTTALDLADGMGCNFSDIALVTNRDFSPILKSSIVLYKKSKNLISKKFLKKNVSIFLLQFNGFLLSGGTSEEKGIFSKAGDCTDLISTIDDLKENEIDKFCDKLDSILTVLLKYTGKKNQLNIAKIRCIQNWITQYSMKGVPRIVILEGVEDTSESVKNSLLKCLEEPPTGTHFIIISSNPGRIMATILSRVRNYWFPPIVDNKKNELLGNLFVDGRKYSNLENFFLTYSGIDIEEIDKWIESFLIDKKQFSGAIEQKLDSEGLFPLFYKRLAFRIEILSIEKKLEKMKALKMLKTLNKEVLLTETYNQTGLISFNAIISKLRGIL